jgi:hypothetical protein
MTARRLLQLGRIARDAVILAATIWTACAWFAVIAHH